MKKLPHLQLLTLALVIMAMSACTERIDIDLDQTYVRLAVEGYITPEAGKQYIKLTKTSDYFYNNTPPTVSGAVVQITTGDSTVIFTEDSQNPGYYVAPEGFVGVPESTYQLDIELQEAVNQSRNYRSMETMPHQTTDIDSITLEYNPRWERWLVHLYATEPPSVDYYLFDAINNGVLITDSIQRKVVSEDKLFNGSQTNGAVVQVLNKDEVAPGDTITLVLSNITKEYYDFILSVQEEIQSKNPLFSGPAANVNSNVEVDAVGYFAAYPSTYTIRVAETPEDWEQGK